LHVLDSNTTVITLERTGATLNTSIQYKNATKTIFSGLNSNGGYSVSTTNDLLTSSIITATADGKVGIGTTDTKGYKLAVNGSVVATSVVVKLYANWPDYVFKKDYQLRPLAEIKSYIDQNQHLPEMPSAKEIATNGQNLGEINQLLTKKVEELTLYLIENNKKQEEQEARLKKLEEQLEALTKK